MTAASPPQAERSPTALTVRGLRKAFGLGVGARWLRGHQPEPLAAPSPRRAA